MFVVTNNIKVKKGHALEVAERFRQPKGVSKFSGFVKMEVLLSELEEHDELAIRTTWEEEQNFKNWTESEDFRGAHRQSAGERPSPGIMLGSYLTKQQFLFEKEKEEVKA